MKFGKYFEENKISEWSEFYIDFNLLKFLIKQLEHNYKTIVKRKNTLILKNVNELQEPLLMNSQTESDKQVLLTEEEEFNYQKNFQEEVLIEIKKIEFFLEHNLAYYHSRLTKIREQLNHINIQKQYKIYNDNLEFAIKELYKELHLILEYVELNFKAKYKIIKKFKKITKYSKTKIDVESICNDYINNSPILSNPQKKFNHLQADIEKTFSTYFFSKYSFQSGKILKEYTRPSQFSPKQAFYLGFWVGILVLMVFVNILIGSYFKIDMDDDVEFGSLFPMFRGYGMICLYLWLLGLDVYAWNIAHINYALCFGFTYKFSNVLQIFVRAAVFSSFLLFMIMIYFVTRIQLDILSFVEYLIPLQYTPLICWLCLLIYLFFPFKSYFNYPGRIYFFTLFLESISSIFIHTEFKHVWFMDQLTSFVGPMRDMEYTLCYYANYNMDYALRSDVCARNRGIVLIIGVFPHFIRILQCIRIILDSHKTMPQLMNCGKYFFAIMTAILSFLMIDYPGFIYFWWIIATISTIYSTYWDIKYDFGFLQAGTNYPLREKLSYKNKAFYYFNLFADVFLRFVWLLTVSPEIVESFVHPQFLSLLLFSLEILRRSMWNFIRVELKHIEICKEFKVTIDVQLPFKKLKNGKFVLKSTDLVDFLKMNKRMQKIKTLRIGSLMNRVFHKGTEETGSDKRLGIN
jgi:hypothetical protein